MEEGVGGISDTGDDLKRLLIINRNKFNNIINNKAPKSAMKY